MKQMFHVVIQEGIHRHAAPMGVVAKPWEDSGPLPMRVDATTKLPMRVDATTKRRGMEGGAPRAQDIRLKRKAVKISVVFYLSNHSIASVEGKYGRFLPCQT